MTDTKNLIKCGTCGYPLTVEERTSLVEEDGVMVKPPPKTGTLTRAFVSVRTLPNALITIGPNWRC